MKLYATVTSERASKGQGGNDYLQINIFDAAQVCHGTIEVLPDMSLWVRYNGEKVEIKGKKQKGECKHLRRTRTGDPKTEYWGYKCDDCGKFA
ncbi:MAG: hypothetical protein AAB922_03235 [Patescibacteria group bacterium]|mgnify:CR=1 FL=1